jgi:hypothetical protein
MARPSRTKIEKRQLKRLWRGSRNDSQNWNELEMNGEDCKSIDDVPRSIWRDLSEAVALPRFRALADTG